MPSESAPSATATSADATVAAPSPPTKRETCPICDGPTAYLGTIQGRVVKRPFELRVCDACDFRFVADPTDEYGLVYDEAYYDGRGADPLVDYRFEFERPDVTVRRHEWEGTRRLIDSLVPLKPGVRWLDFGCGTGTLVRHVRQHARCECVGYDVGWVTDKARAAGVPVLTDAELAAAEGTFDVVTSVEVIEHVADPVAWLRQVRRMLRPGGAFYLTTGNVDRQRANFLSWSYVVPDLHTSFFTPKAAAAAMRAAGLVPEPLGWRPGCAQIIRSRALKNLRLRQDAAWHPLLMWPVLSRVLNWKVGLFDYPIGRAPTA
jgi:2-polyprenyl-3-methyl-5-hydroxy-6-metoxy-1,4-benzoquinol methylase